MRNLFESRRRDITEAEIIPDGCGFKSASKKYINRNYERIGRVLGIEEELLINIKKQAKEENKLPYMQGDLSLEQINFYRGHYNFSPFQDEYAAIKAQNTSAEGIRDDQLGEGLTEGDQPEIDSDGQEHTTAEGEELQVEEGVVVSGEPTPGKSPEEAKDSEGGEGAEDELPGAEGLQAVLDSLINESVQQHSDSAAESSKLAKIEGREYTGEPDIETNLNALELDIFRERAQEAINKYQEFHNSFLKEYRTPEIQEQYRSLEKEAWDRVRELAYKLGGNISQELPQLRNILESHRDLNDSKNAKEYLLQQGNILVNEEGNITHIVDDEGNEFELNRPRTFEEIFNQSRPVHILYRTNEEGKKIGYIIEGLNLNTPDWIEGVLSDKQFLESVIVDETEQPAAQTTEVVAPSETNPEASAENLDPLNPLRRRVELYISMDNIGFSRDALIRQLESQGFTNEQATQAIDSINIDWNQQATKSARGYLQSREASKENWSRNDLIRQLEYEKFTEEQARFAVDSISDYPWKEDVKVDESEQSEGGETTPQNSNPHGNNTQNNPEASADNLDPLESYRQQGFNQAQLAFIENAIDAGDTPDKISLYAKLEYEVAQMIVERAKKLNPELDISKYEGLPYWKQIWIIAGMRTGLIPEQIVLYLEKDISSDEIAEIQSYIENGLTIEKMIEKKIIEIAKGYLNGDIGFSRYSLIEQLESKGFTDEQATQVIDSMNIDWNQEAVKSATSYLKYRLEDNKNWSKNELIQQLVEFEKFTNDEAIFAVNSITSYEWKENAEAVQPQQSEVGANTPQGLLDDLRLAYARAEEAWNRKRGDEQLEDTFISAREAYNKELEKVLKLQVAEGQADTISQMFKDEVIALRDSRTTQSQELQGKWEKGFNNAKEKFLGWATKNKTRWMLANMGLFAAGALLSSIGVGIPVIGSLEMTRRSLGSVMAGVGSRNTLVGLMEDRDIKINKFGLNINFQAEVPKIVKESISEEDKIKAVSEDVLKERLGTLEAYYRLNGGKFTKDNQQQAYEKVLTELARRVQKNVIDAENPNLSIQPSTNEQSENEKQNSSPESGESDKQYISTLLNTISDKRIAELDKFRRKRQIANVVGFATTGVLGGLLLNDMLKPGGIFRSNIENSGQSANNDVSTTSEVKSTGAGTTSTESSPNPQASPTPSETPSTNVSTQEVQNPVVNTDGAGGTETSSGVPKPNLDTTTPTGTGAATNEALRQAREATEQAKELSRDVSSLDSGETIWGEITKQLGENASQAQIQQAVENYLQSQSGQESIFELAKQTEGGREFLARWSIDNAGEMARLELKDLYEVSKYLGEGELEGLTKLSLDNLDALSPAEYTAPSPLESPVNTSQFTKSLSEAIGANNLTDSQIGSVLEAYADTDQGRKSLYNLIITSKANNPAISEILDRYNITYETQLSDLPADQLNILAQEVGVENLDQLPGFELNDIIWSKFEDAPDTVDLVKGSKPLDMVNRYIASEIGNLPYDSSLGQQVLNTYLETPQGKQWLYDAIVNNPDINNQNIQYFKEYLRFKGITSPEEFVKNFNWVEFSGNRNIPTSGFWNQIRLQNGNILQPLSTFLQPSKMIGIKDAVRQVLTR